MREHNVGRRCIRPRARAGLIEQGRGRDRPRFLNPSADTPGGVHSKGALKIGDGDHGRIVAGRQDSGESAQRVDHLVWRFPRQTLDILQLLGDDAPTPRLRDDSELTRLAADGAALVRYGLRDSQPMLPRGDGVSEIVAEGGLPTPSARRATGTGRPAHVSFHTTTRWRPTAWQRGAHAVATAPADAQKRGISLDTCDDSSLTVPNSRQDVATCAHGVAIRAACAAPLLMPSHGVRDAGHSFPFATDHVGRARRPQS